MRPFTDETRMPGPTAERIFRWRGRDTSYDTSMSKMRAGACRRRNSTRVVPIFLARIDSVWSVSGRHTATSGSPTVMSRRRVDVHVLGSFFADRDGDRDGAPAPLNLDQPLRLRHPWRHRADGRHSHDARRRVSPASARRDAQRALPDARTQRSFCSLTLFSPPIVHLPPVLSAAYRSARFAIRLLSAAAPSAGTLYPHD